VSDPKATAPVPTVSGFRPRAMRVLLIEDEEPSRELLASEMERAGFLVHQAENGHDGLEQVRRFVPDVVVLDLMLPVLSGFAVARAIRAQERSRNVAIVAVSALASEALRVEALAAGCDAFLRKPVPAALVVEQVRQLAALRRPGVPSGGQP
jgi:DNA-binding response OmpR family regulator